jgi:hypothetical protein
MKLFLSALAIFFGVAVTTIKLAASIYDTTFEAGPGSPYIGYGVVGGVTLYRTDWSSSNLATEVYFSYLMRVEIENYTIRVTQFEIELEEEVTGGSVEYVEVSLGVFEPILIKKTIKPFKAVFQWVEAAPLYTDKTTYRFSTSGIQCRVEGDPIICEYTITGPTETKSGSVTLQFPETCILGPLDGSQRIVFEPTLDEIGLEFDEHRGSSNHFFKVSLIGTKTIHETVDGKEISIDLNDTRLGPINSSTLYLIEDNLLIQAGVSPHAGGVATGGGTYLLSDEVTLEAMPNPGYVFSGWSDPYTAELNPFTFQPSSDVIITAQFIPDEADDDGDNLSNYNEIVVHLTDPKISDSDDDHIPDGVEVSAGLDPLTPDIELIAFIKENASSFGMTDDAEIQKLKLNGSLILVAEEETAILSAQLLEFNVDGSLAPLGQPFEWTIPFSDRLMLQLESSLTTEVLAPVP